MLTMALLSMAKLLITIGPINKDLEAYLKDAGLDIYALRTFSSSRNNGWDWIIIEVGYDSNRTLVSRIYSGFKNEDGGLTKTQTTNIEKYMYGK